jgi:hypothetical protein
MLLIVTITLILSSLLFIKIFYNMQSFFCQFSTTHIPQKFTIISTLYRPSCYICSYAACVLIMTASLDPIYMKKMFPSNKKKVKKV